MRPALNLSSRSQQRKVVLTVFSPTINRYFIDEFRSFLFPLCPHVFVLAAEFFPPLFFFRSQHQAHGTSLGAVFATGTAGSAAYAISGHVDAS